MDDVQKLLDWPDGLRSSLSLPPRLIALIQLAVAAEPTAVGAGLLEDSVAFAEHLRIPQLDILEAQRLGSLVAFHSVTWGLKIVADEFEQLGVQSAPASNALHQLKAEYLKSSGDGQGHTRPPERPWGAEMELAGGAAPDGLAQMLAYVPDAIPGSNISREERELVFIALDLNCTHMYEGGLRRHIRVAIGAGIEPAMIAQVALVVTWLQRASFRTVSMRQSAEP